MDSEVKRVEKIGQEQFQSFVFGKNHSWQEIINDLINTEQLDPWDINLAILAQKYLEKIRDLEEANFALSSKVLLVASLMLRIKSELLMNKFIKSLDDLLFNKESSEIQNRLELEEYHEGEIPELYPRTPLPRFKKVDIRELMEALSKAIKTEERRDLKKRVERESYERTKLFMPKKSIPLIDRIKQVHEKVISLFKKQEKIPFSQITDNTKEGKINHFIPLLHLDNHGKLWLQQEKHFEEIWIHKDGSQFIQKDEILTDEIEREFEDNLEEGEEDFDKNTEENEVKNANKNKLNLVKE
ncbi:MAG: segregation/condensation protein A [Candidatus Pacearchaeota archaeon]